MRGGDCPNGQFGSIRGPHFAKDPVQVFLDGAFGEVQLVSDFLVQFGLTDELDNLLLPKAEGWIEGPLEVFRDRTARADSSAGLAAEFHSASKTVSQWLQFNNGRHEFETPFQIHRTEPTARRLSKSPP